jgi:hypothetical protein
LSNLAAVGRDTALYKQTLEELSESKATITTSSTAAAKAAKAVRGEHGWVHPGG